MNVSDCAIGCASDFVDEEAGHVRQSEMYDQVEASGRGCHHALSAIGSAIESANVSADEANDCDCGHDVANVSANGLQHLHANGCSQSHPAETIEYE